MQPGCKILCNMHLSGSAASLISNPELPPHWQLRSSMSSCYSALRPTTAAETRVGPDTDVCLSPHLLDWQYLLTYSHFEGSETMIERNIGIVNIMPNAWFTWALDLKLSFWRQQDLKLYCLLYSFYLIPIHLFQQPSHKKWVGNSVFRKNQVKFKRYLV